MKDIMNAPFLVEMVRTTTNMYNHGWDERNGGNISYLLGEAQVAEYLDVNAVIRDIPTGFEAPALDGKYFIVTGIWTAAPSPAPCGRCVPSAWWCSPRA